MGATVAHMAVRVLSDAGINHAYAVPGHAFLELLEFIAAEPRIRLINARQEAGAAFMAEAEGKLTDRPALLLAGRGISAAQLAPGVQAAMMDETPMVVVLDAVRSTSPGVPDVDLAAMFRPLAKWSASAESADQVPGLLADAVVEASTGRRGPVVLSVPNAFWSAPFDTAVPLSGPPGERAGALVRAGGEVAALVGEAKYPVVIVGGRARSARTELIAVAEELGLSVYTAFRRQDTFPENHARYAGNLGLGLPPRQLDALDRADVILALGTQLDEVTTQDFRYPLSSQTLVLVGTGTVSVPRRGMTVRVDAEVEPFLRELRAVAAPRTRRTSAANAAVHTFMTAPDTSRNPRVHPAGVVTALRRLAPEDSIVTTDGGNLAAFVHRYWCFTAPRSQLGAGNAVTGYAVPAAVAAKLCEPSRTVIAIVGDTDALMTGQEVETAVRYRLPIVVVICQNGIYDSLALHQAQSTGRLSGVSLPPVDFAAWARGLGAAGYTVDGPDELVSALSRALVHQRPSVVDVRTDPDVLTPDRRLSTLLSGARTARLVE